MYAMAMIDDRINGYWVAANKLVKATNNPALGFCFVALAARLRGSNIPQPITGFELAELFGVSRKTAARYVDALAQFGAIEKIVQRVGNRNLPNMYRLTGKFYPIGGRGMGTNDPKIVQLVPQNRATRGNILRTDDYDDDDTLSNAKDNINNEGQTDPEKAADSNEAILRAFGVHAPHCREFEHIDRATVEAWIEAAKAQPALKNPAGFVVAKLRAGDDAPTVAPVDDVEAVEERDFTGATLRTFNADWVETGADEPATDEPTVADEPATDEPTVADEPATDEPIVSERQQSTPPAARLIKGVCDFGGVIFSGLAPVGDDVLAELAGVEVDLVLGMTTSGRVILGALDGDEALLAELQNVISRPFGLVGAGGRKIGIGG